MDQWPQRVSITHAVWEEKGMAPKCQWQMHSVRALNAACYWEKREEWDAVKEWKIKRWMEPDRRLKSGMVMRYRKWRQVGVDRARVHGVQRREKFFKKRTRWSHRLEPKLETRESYRTRSAQGMGCESSLVESGQMEEKEEEEEMGVLQLVCLAKTYDERDGKQRRCSNPYVHPGSLWSSLRGSKTQQNKTLT